MDFGAISRPKENLIFATGLKMFVFERLSSVPFYLRHFVFSSSLSFFDFFEVEGRARVERHQDRLRRRLFNTGSGEGRRSSQPAACSIRGVWCKEGRGGRLRAYFFCAFFLRVFS